MLFQILDANYTYDSQKRPLVQLFGETEEGKSVTCKVAGFRPYFYAGVKEGALDEVTQDLIEMGLEVESVDRFEPIGYQVVPKRMLKIITKDPKEVRTLRDRVRELPGVKAIYETDILFKNRFLIDRGLGGMGWAEAKLPEWVSDQEPPLINLDSLIPIQHDANAPLRYMSFDIECLPDHGEMPRAEVSPVILISMAFEPEYKGQKDLVLVGKNIDCPRPDVQVCQNEHALLSAFASILREYDPDVVAGYNSNEFDFPYLLERAKQLRVDLRTGRDGSSCYLRKIVNSTNVSITGRVVVDLLPIIRSSYSLKQYTLRNASAELLKMEKYDVDPKEIESLWADGGEGLRRFISYSRRDAILAQRLLLDLKLMDKYIALSRASGALLQDIVNGGQSGMVENLLLRRFGEVNRVVSPKPDIDVANDRYFEKPQNYSLDHQFNNSSTELSDEMHVENNGSDELKGGAVLEPEKGLLEDLVILDYKSLYPTIMMAHNLCYSTVVTDQSPALAFDKTILAPSGGKFVSPEISPGIMPQVLKELLDQRTETKSLMKKAGEEERRFLDAKQYAMKILLNSFYGYSGYARARLYSLTLANAVTSFGRENILRTKKVIDDIGTVYVINGDVVFKDKMIFGKTVAKGYDLSVVYGDTDSVFVRLKPSEPRAKAVSLDDAKLIGKKIAETVTSSLPQPMELVFEAFARRAIFQAKKRYALYLFEPVGEVWKDRIKVRGMETVRRDWCGLTSKTLNTCLELMLKEGKVEEAKEHVRSVVFRLQNLDLTQDPSILEDLTLTRRYTKGTGSYKNKQPHVQLVEKIKKRGGQAPGVGDRVPFVIIQGKRGSKSKELFVNRAEDPAYALEKNLSLDTDYYVDKQILPPVLRIFEGFGVTKDWLRMGGVQGTLFGFGEMSKPQKQKKIFDF